MKTVVDQFRQRAGTYSGSARWIADKALLQVHIDACGTKRPGHLLEVCCGTGMVGRNFAGAGWRVCGLDLTREMAEEANRHFPCICTSAESIPFLDGAFDAAVLRQAYFLIEDGQKVLSEISRVLKPGGVFVMSQTVPYSSEDSEWLEKVHRAKQAQLRVFYTEEMLAAELEREYFRVTGVRRMSVRENITEWMAAAPELAEEKRREVCELIANAPEAYRRIHKVEVIEGDILEDWNWVIFSAEKKK